MPEDPQTDPAATSAPSLAPTPAATPMPDQGEPPKSGKSKSLKDYALRLSGVFAVLGIAAFAFAAADTFITRGADSSDPCRAISTGGYQATLPESRQLKTASPADAKGVIVIDFAPRTIGLGGQICVAIRKGQDAPATLADTHLMLNGLSLGKVQGNPTDPDGRLFLFQVTRATEDAASWDRIIGLPGFGSTSVSVGMSSSPSGIFAQADQLPQLSLRLFTLTSFWLGALSFLLALLCVAVLGWCTGLLRDGQAGTTFSLARVQMMFWSFLVTTGFLYIWLVTGSYNGVLTTSALALMGISATTGLSAVAIPGGGAPTLSNGFFPDLLNDDNGITVHRLQMAVWTLILGAVFLYQVFTTMKLPDFDPNLLILMGMSGGTYIGFKFSEAKSG